MRRSPRFFRQQPRQARHSIEEPVTVKVESLSHDGRGIARRDGKALFVDGALPGETVEIRLTKQQKRFDEGQLLQLLETSPDRLEPPCPHYSRCGGCQLQHLQPQKQLELKQQQALQQLQRLGKVTPATLLPPLDGPHWGYRRRARLSISCHKTGGRVLLGFRARGSKQLAQIDQCPVLEPRANALLAELQQRLHELQRPQALSHLEIALGDDDCSLLVRHPQPLHSDDQQLLLGLCETHAVQLYMQPGSPNTITRINGTNERLHYQLQTCAAPVTLAYHPGDFTQINATINQAMVTQALALLAPSKDDRILDLFCGLGNFTLPLARSGATLVGVEGSSAMVERATENARNNQLDQCRFYTADLTSQLQQQPWFGEGFNKLLLDPPRAGAVELIRQLPLDGVERLLYVSCDPATFARDAGELAQRGLTLQQWGVMNMFPHTSHIESMGLFLRR